MLSLPPTVKRSKEENSVIQHFKFEEAGFPLSQMHTHPANNTDSYDEYCGEAYLLRKTLDIAAKNRDRTTALMGC